MSTATRIALALAALLIAGAAKPQPPKDELCTQLSRYESAPFALDKDGKPTRRAIEYHWISGLAGVEGDTAWFCRASTGDTPSQTFCDWLFDSNVSVDFPTDLPFRILACRGYTWPQGPKRWSTWLSTITLESEFDDRRLDLTIDIRTRESRHEALRLTIIPHGDFTKPTPLIDDTTNPLVE